MLCRMSGLYSNQYHCGYCCKQQLIYKNLFQAIRKWEKDKDVARPVEYESGEHGNGEDAESWFNNRLHWLGAPKDIESTILCAVGYPMVQPA